MVTIERRLLSPNDLSPTDMPSTSNLHSPSTLSPTKTEIVYFSTRPSPVDLYFFIDNIKIKLVDAHNHIGVTLSADGKR
jgi:hypothetical protein